MSIIDLQKKIIENKMNKGFNTTDINKEFCLLYGEIAEAYDAWCKNKVGLGEELADVAIYLLGIAQIEGLDLGEEILKKIEINEKRKYKLSSNDVHIKVENEDL